MGGVPQFRLEMARHQERIAQSSVSLRSGMEDALKALEPLNGRIAPIPDVQRSHHGARERPSAQVDAGKKVPAKTSLAPATTNFSVQIWR